MSQAFISFVARKTSATVEISTKTSFGKKAATMLSNGTPWSTGHRVRIEARPDPSVQSQDFLGPN
ncbi:hypothetical protein RUND412_008035 [Rhizina undulata]